MENDVCVVYLCISLVCVFYVVEHVETGPTIHFFELL